MANFEPMPFRRAFGSDPGSLANIESTSAPVEAAPFVDVSGVTKMRTAVTGACRKCGYAGHLPFQCRNFLQPKDSKESFVDVSSTSSESEYETPLTSKEDRKKKKEERKRRKKERKREKKERKKRKKERKHKKRKHSHSSSSESDHERKKRKKKRRSSTSSSDSS